MNIEKLGNYREMIVYLTHSALFLVLAFFFLKKLECIYMNWNLFAIICISVQNVIFPLPVLMQYFNGI